MQAAPLLTSTAFSRGGGGGGGGGPLAWEVLAIGTVAPSPFFWNAMYPAATADAAGWGKGPHARNKLSQSMRASQEIYNEPYGSRMKWACHACIGLPLAWYPLDGKHT